jgi:outer membrane receptor protein involved in Fe transport
MNEIDCKTVGCAQRMCVRLLVWRAAAAVAVGGLNIVVPAAYAQTAEFNVEAGILSDALMQLSRQANVDISAPSTVTNGKRAPAVKGAMSVETALDRLLAGSGLSARRIRDRSFVVEPVGNGPAAAETAAPIAKENARAESPARAEVRPIVVTGSRIREIETPSPVTDITARQIRDEGYADLGDVIRSVPQNFSGGQNPGVLESGGSIANQNVTGGSGLNLRGLGPDATLTLLNGRRLSYSGLFQAVDISSIPVEAVDRIEIVPDGSSAIYGSDAVAGVGNVILKRDFRGLTLGTRQGGAADGGLGTHDYTATGGAVWSSGGFIASYKNASADPVYASQRAYTEAMTGPRTLYPGDDLSSGLLSLHQDLGDRITFRLDALHASRQSYRVAASTTVVTRIPAKSRSTLVSPVLEARLPGDWSLSLGASWSRDVSATWYDQTAVATGATSRPLDQSYINKSRSYDVGFEGPLFRLGGGNARLAVGAGSRAYSFDNEDRLTGLAVIHGRESDRFAYAELALPFVGPKTRIRGVDRLIVTAAVRGEQYNSFGGVVTPRLGLVYAPAADVTLKGAWGRSFKAPTLAQRFQQTAVYIMPASWVGGTGYAPDATVLMTWGGNKDLKPERAATWSATVEFHPVAVPAFNAELTWFNVAYRGRVVQPLAAYWLALGDDRNAPYIIYSPTPGEIAGAAASGTLIDQGGTGYSPDTVVAILQNEYTNAMRQKARGADLSASYRFDLARGNLTLRGSASWLRLSQQTSAGQPEYILSGTVFNAASFHGRAGAVWDHRGWTTSAFVNHISGVSAGNAVDAGSDGRTGSFTTIDAAVRYQTPAGPRLWSGIDIVASAQNLFNRAPPLYIPATAASTAPYDSLNYSAVGRFLSISLSKHW